MELLKYGNLTLKEKSKEVTSFDDKLAYYADEMYDVMCSEKGLGLAASQVGLLIRLIVIEIDEGKGRYDLVNPCIKSHSDDLVEGEEGCLSIPGVYANVVRYSNIYVEALNLKGEKINFQAKDLFARVIQHEIDHLDGILFIDRLNELDKKNLKRELKKIKKNNIF